MWSRAGYERGSDGRYRNGYRRGHVDCAEGRIDVQMPQVRRVPGYRSKLLEEVKAWLGSVRDAPTAEVGGQTAAEMIARFEAQYPAAMKSFADDLDASLAHLRVPVAHRRYVPTTRLIERSFVEERRRTKVIE